ncbi:MAG: hypothetical protein ACODAB_01140 [Gemmatimonadota bacterium]
MDEILDVTLRVAEALDELDVPYVVGGSLASSFHGIPRATIDADIVAALRPQHHPGFVDALRDAFYLDPDTIRRAIDRRTSFNVVHLATMFKVDVFVAPDDDAAGRELERGRSFVVTSDPERRLRMASAEDTIAHKLYWYALGDEIADRQWSDAIGVLKVAGDQLDHDYLRRRATLLGVRDLLAQALKDL